MNTVTSADSSYYAANTNEKTEKRLMFGHDTVWHHWAEKG